MREKSKVKMGKPDFTEQIPEYSDQEIMAILKRRDHYQPEAARLAIVEALNRGLINSEDDLLAIEYRVKPLKKSLFPKIENESHRKKISRSISRGLLIAGIIPIIFGILKINEGRQIEGGLIVASGIIWMIFSTQTIRNVNLKILRLFFVLLIIAAVYLVKVFIQLKSIIFMDIFIVAAIYCLTIYGLLYLIKLHQKENTTLENN